MTRSFGPVVVVNPNTLAVDRVHCNWCIFRSHHGSHTCTYQGNLVPALKGHRTLPDPSETPDWCQMKAGAIQDSLDMANGVTHRVWRWSGRITDAPRVIYEGIPSEALRQFKLASRDAKRGTVRLRDADGGHIAMWPTQEREGAE